MMSEKRFLLFSLFFINGLRSRIRPRGVWPSSRPLVWMARSNVPTYSSDYKGPPVVVKLEEKPPSVGTSPSGLHYRWQFERKCVGKPLGGGRDFPKTALPFWNSLKVRSVMSFPKPRFLHEQAPGRFCKPLHRMRSWLQLLVAQL